MSPQPNKQTFSPQYSILLIEQVTDFLTQAILDGQFKSGDRLVEAELQRELGVSRTPIRESFRILEKKGLITKIPRKGTFVRKIVQKDIEEISPIRANLEGLSGRLAVPKLTSQDLEKMKIVFSKMCDAAKDNKFRSYVDYHLQFHDIFIRATKNDTLIEILEDLRNQSIWFRYSYIYLQEDFEYSLKVHRKILDYFIKKDADHLEPLIKEHILIYFDRFIEFLESKE